MTEETPKAQAEREAFEAQMRVQFGPFVTLARVGDPGIARHAGQEIGDYEADTIQSCWITWQAARVPIGRAMGIEEAAKVIDGFADRCQERHDLCQTEEGREDFKDLIRSRRAMAAAIRSSIPPLDLDALTERVAQSIAANVHTVDSDRRDGPWIDGIGDAARAVLSVLIGGRNG